MGLRIGIIYATTDGQTLKICHQLQTIFTSKGIPTEMCTIESFKGNLSDFTLLIIGASIRYGKHHKKVYEFIETNRAQLDTIKTAFFSVNLVARKEDKNSANTNPYLIKFLKEINWKATYLEVFAGKLDYKSYSFWDRVMIKLIMKLTDGPTKTVEPIEFTKWDSVDSFGLRISNDLKKSIA
ncbi:menaquinone-dependent protoporphyrinogen IX dehydrogenase [Wenyingzhuangia aestuarii]|uniref:menaquinone-dependent protoporphyrinogen IX dehydrogenase n=1 Tax=Wenyingzhuangia aestuarii TaxID=1647582 RepID=UPI00143CB8D9|nr:menaquinone-dependent protoporphyrinogen IX dehydrogenase [Wenyingzhuangia aestuarii]NJB83358.1 menaquinone-dependent protoporphyrinogen oxidase [Wenyingzhuangia aestuarii]